ncbi:MAG: large subunit ribosomal protein L20 [Lysobacterales bacterium]|jgi:large subunit ribosomal protein L20
MVRIKGTIAAKTRRKKVLKKASGQFGRRSTNFRQAIKSVIKGMTYEYRDRKVRKREFRSLWIVRINAACKENGINYSRFMNGLAIASVEVNRKVLADLAISSPEAFTEIVKIAKEALVSGKKAVVKEAVNA